VGLILLNLLCENKCIICNKEKEKGLEILGKNVCNLCENNLISSYPLSDEYYEYILALKKIFKNI